ncbi:serine hydrolase domain-containing protein [Methylobacterium radiodurans]|uniref:Serine hydrolase n=1 Tax=Methylobacterium radiodurans TaxID=2202828 RepID=A0A2U8VN71_9HYPH|nr:serine hydrolase [Methylobacterium radiodurans]AWN35064.1 serine hydrolase [Methylobacterium radiodurans]
MKRYRILTMGCMSLLCNLSAVALARPQDEVSANSPDIASVQSVYDGRVLPDIQARTFRNIDRLFPTRTVNRDMRGKPLAEDLRNFDDLKIESDGKAYDIYDYISLNRIGGLLVLKDDKIVFEDYELGNTPTSRWMSMSVAKSITSTLIGAAIKDGHIKSIDDDLTVYLPELKGSAYDGVSVKNLLRMASGVKWDETYTNPRSDRRRMLELQQAGKPGEIVKFMASLPRAAPPGTVWNYSTGETHIAGALVRAAVGRPVAEYLSDKIWSKIGAQDDATWWLEAPNGLEVGGSGFSATLRDYARFGLFVLNGGKVGDTQVVPEGWFDQAGRPQDLADKTVNYGYMWWPLAAPAGSPNQDAFQARGIFGQSVYVNPRERLVIVHWGARSKPTGIQPVRDPEFYAAVVRKLQFK